MGQMIDNTLIPQPEKQASRMLCVWLPDFPIQRLRYEQPETKSAACVLYAESGHRAQVVTASSEARRFHIHAEMTLAEAQALAESAVFLPHDAEADASELQSLVELCHRYSPLVGLELLNDTHCLILDISGCSHLFGGEAGLARQLVVDLAERGYFAHVAVANTIGAAWAIARYGHGTGSDRRLRSLPIEALRIPQKLIAQLHEFDLRTVGRLAALPGDSLPSRFGSVLNKRLDQMFGRRQELLVPVARPEPVSAEWITDDAISRSDAIRYVCTELLTEILDTLKSRREGLLKLTLSLHSEQAGLAVIEIGLARPADSLTHVFKLIELKLETVAAPESIHTVRLEASATAPLQIRQRALFAHQEPEEDGNEHVRRLTDRLSARLGSDAVVRPRLLPEAVPEQAVEFVALTQPSPESELPVALTIASARPPVLWPQPEPVSVISAASGQPVSFQWNRRTYQIARSTEVERIATGWWQDAGSVRRDYRQVEIRSGARFWLFQDGSGKWFLHGVFE